jgi:hypothetical protein
MNEEANPVEHRIGLEKVLDAMETFIKSPALEFYKNARLFEIASIKEAIVTIDPVDRKDEIESFKMRGELRTTEEFLTFFEDTVASLKDRIATLRETEQPSNNSTQT